MKPGSRMMASLAVTLASVAAVGCASPPAARHSNAGSPGPVRAATSRPARPPASGSPPAPSTTALRCGGAGATTVTTAAGLRQALAAARPGQTIALAPGVYQDDFVATASGTSGAPVTLCGSRAAVLQGRSIRSGYVFHLDGASWWRLEGFTVEGGQKGVVTDHASHNLIEGLYVHTIGDEAIHLRAFSSYNVVSHNVVRDTGLVTQFFGEGIYVGSANKNWCRYSGCKPDASNYNVITGNNIADTTAENIDIKEGTTGGVITGNTFNGTGMVPSAATSWVNVKGNGWLIEGNTGTVSDENGFSVHQVYPGWGLSNTFRGNTATFTGPGYGIYVQSHHLGTVVACNNVAHGPGGGISNISCANVS
jgi:parallel beta helix pectate lyase-like protein